ncbi:MAG: M1 family aminopeptidase [Candidatus Zixiibacteriota bacterium]
MNNQFLGSGEHYGEFGTYEASITLPAHYIVAATGVLQNKEEVLPDSLREKLDIKHFKDKPWNSKASVILPKVPGETKTWRYKAENVTDFTWVADPTFRIGEAEWDGIKIYAFAQEKHAARWQTAAEVGRQGIEYFSTNFGRYPYPQMSITDSYDGMEYPMIVLCGGESPSYRLLLWHEIAHNWYMGAVGSNPVDRAFLDEGFTTFLEINIIEALHGRKGNVSFWDTKWKKKLYPVDEDRAARGYRNYLFWHKTGFAQRSIIEADRSPERMVYRTSSYYKTVVLLFNLQYALGDSVFARGMKDYFEKWHFKHPYEENFQAAMEEAAGTKLEWFFDQWINTNRTADYGIGAAHTKATGKSGDSAYLVTGKIYRSGELVMPIDLGFKLKSGGIRYFTIPVNDYRKPDSRSRFLPIWDQVRLPEKEYQFEVYLPAKPKEIEIDPSGRLADTNPLNNRLKSFPDFPKADLQLNNLAVDVLPVDRYHFLWRPSLWYNRVDGIMLGANLQGSYLGLDHVFWADGLKATKKLERGNIDFSYSTPFMLLGQGGRIFGKARLLEGREFYEVGLSKTYRPRQLFPPVHQLSFSIIGEELIRSEYLTPYQPWSASGRQATSFYASWSANLQAAKTIMNMGVTWEAWAGAELDGRRLWGWFEMRTPIRKKFELYFRGYAGLANRDAPPQKKFYLSSANPEEALNAPVVRSRGVVPTRLLDNVRLTGGGNVRGFYPQNLFGDGIASATFEFTVPQLAPMGWLPKVPLLTAFFKGYSNYVFADFGALGFYRKGIFGIGDEAELDAKGYLDLGAGLRFPHVWPKHRFRLDFPFYRYPKLNEDNFRFRWVVGWEVEV